MNANSALQASLKNEMEMYRAKLGSIGLIDIGTIVSVNEIGRAVVHGSSFVGGQQTVYEDAEIIYPGNAAGAFTSECTGTVCLIFIPRSCMPDTTTQNVRFSVPAYSKAGVKVMPIGNAADCKIDVHRGAAGNFSVTTPIYNISCEKDAFSISSNDGTTSFSLDPVGNLHLIRQGNNGTYYKDFTDGKIEQTWLSANKDVKWVDSLNSDGSRTFVQSDPNDEEADPLFSLTIAADGTASVTLSQGLTLETKGTLALKGENVTIDSTGDNSTVAINGTNLVVDK